MAKRKRPATKKLSVAPKIVLDDDTIPISIADDKIKFGIMDDNGNCVGILEDSVVILHQIALMAQQEDPEGVNYLPAYAKNLSKKYNLPINEVAAYRIANYVFNNFAGVKKNMDG